MTVYAYDGVSPTLPGEGRYWVAPTADVMGKVTLGEDVSIWFGAVLRGDHPDHGIRVGARTSIQDNCVLHVSARGATLVGDDANASSFYLPSAAAQTHWSTRQKSS